MFPTPYVVITDTVASYPETVTFRKSDRVQVTDRETDDPEWDGWLWCEGGPGKAAWVPAAVLDISGESGILLEDYCARELSVSSGDTVMVSKILFGWAWAETIDHRSGWVPLRHIRMREDAGLSIRVFQELDREGIIQLWGDCNLLVPWNDPNRDIDRKLAADPGGFMVGLIERQVVASCMAGYDGHRGWLNYLAVSPGHRREGIGRQMVAAAESRLRKAGCPKVNLQVRETNTDAIDFYRQIGFAVDSVISLGKRLVSDEPPNTHT
jgi:ribosomal protein S18 acetylase RimI-like enzyme